MCHTLTGERQRLDWLGSDGRPDLDPATVSPLLVTGDGRQPDLVLGVGLEVVQAD